MATGGRPCVMKLLAAVLGLVVAANSQDCQVFTSCDECISTSPECAWCNDPDAFISYVSTREDTVGAARLCGTVEFLQTNLSCLPANIVNPKSTASLTDPVEPTSAQVFPASADVTVRPGIPASFNVTVRPAESISVDMYILMDLTYTLRPVLNNLRTLASDLIALMQDRSDNFRIGFGSYVDKTVGPFIDLIARDFPCARENDPTLTPSVCGRAYSYQHTLSFTENSTAFQEALDAAKFSASTDPPESLYDALMQIALCEDELGWSPRGQTRRIVMVMTDGDYHYALDGKIGGLTTPPDLQCRVNPSTGRYDDDILFDYPSTTTVSELLNERDMIPIFAVAQQVESVYESLRSVIRSAIIGELTNDLLTIVDEGYQNLSSTVVPVITGPSADMLRVVPVNSCGPDGTLQPGSEDICVGVTPPNSSVVYTVTIEASPELCQSNQGPLTADIRFPGFGFVSVNITLACECNCSSTVEPGSANCNGTGDWVCSTCVCDVGRGGPTCECPVSSTASDSCVKSFGLGVCSGNGECVCGSCVCNPVNVNNPGLVYTGDFCEYNPLNCPRARPEGRDEFVPCSGNGECINGECVCREGWRGSACECTTNTSACKGPFDDPKDNTSFCSGSGTCKCGQCSCDNYELRFGEFCDECKPCRSSCSTIGDCVYCRLTRGESCDDEDRCDRLVFIYNGTDAHPDKDKTNFKTCSKIDDNCEVRFIVSTLVVGDEDPLYVVIDPDQSDLRTLMNDPDDCSPELLIWPIPVGIILGIILVGIIAIVVWRCISYCGEYLEYQQWMKSLKDETSRTGSNPLFVDPNAKYSNPRYRQPRPQK